MLRLTPDVPADARLLDLLERISADLTHLVQTEVKLAKVEIKDELARTAKGAGFLGGSGYRLFRSLDVVLRGWPSLAEIMPVGFAFLIVGLLYGAGAGTLFVLGR